MTQASSHVISKAFESSPGLHSTPSHGGRLGGPWRGVKALRCVWDGKHDHWLSRLSIKPSQGLIDIQAGGDIDEHLEL